MQILHKSEVILDRPGLRCRARVSLSELNARGPRLGSLGAWGKIDSAGGEIGTLLSTWSVKVRAYPDRVRGTWARVTFLAC